MRISETDYRARMDAIRARVGSLSPSARERLYGAIGTLVNKDVPWLLDYVASLTGHDPTRQEVRRPYHLADSPNINSDRL